MLPDFRSCGRDWLYWANRTTRTFRELLINCDEDRTLRAVLIGMLREDERR